MTEPAAKLPCEVCIVGEAAGVGDLTERQACAQQFPTLQKAGGVIQPNRRYEMAAGGILCRKEFLQVPQRDSRLRRHLARAEGWIGKIGCYDVAEELEQLVRIRRDGHWTGPRL